MGPHTDITRFALNHVTAPGLPWRDFVDLAAKLGCTGVELRNDLAAPLFGGDAPEEVGRHCREAGLRILALAEVYAFNRLSPKVETATADLADLARRSGAEAVVLIPEVDGRPVPFDGLCQALRRLGDILGDAGVRGLIEPIGFAKSSLRDFDTARRAIAETHGPARFGIVHDTFHHHLSGAGSLSADDVDIIHVSGVTGKAAADDMADADRGLVCARDTLGSVAQVHALRAAGATVPVSLECFAPGLHRAPDLAAQIETSLSFMAGQLKHPRDEDAHTMGSGMENA